MDACLYYLMEAEKYLAMYEEVSPYEEIFETYDPQTKIKVEQNEKAKTGIATSFHKALEWIKNAIKNLMDSLKDFINSRKLNAEQREAYEAFKRACAENPELKNKKVTVKDFTKFQKEYDALLKEAEAAERALAEERAFNTDELFNKMGAFCNNVKEGITVSISADAALNMASSSRQIAQSIYQTLKTDQALHDRLVNAIGEKNTKKFEKQVKSLGKRISLQRAVMKMKKTYSTCVADALSKTFSDVKDLVNSGQAVAKFAGDRDAETQLMGNAVSRAADTGKALIKNRKGLGKAVKTVAKSNIARNILGNKAIKGAGIEGIKFASDISRETKDTIKDQKRYVRRAIRDDKKRAKGRVKIHDQSALDSLLGLNDPKSKLK